MLTRKEVLNGLLRGDTTKANEMRVLIPNIAVGSKRIPSIKNARSHASGFTIPALLALGYRVSLLQAFLSLTRIDDRSEKLRFFGERHIKRYFWTSAA